MKRILLLGAVFALACESPTVPPRPLNDIYDFRLQTDTPQVLRWPAGTRVRVHVEGAASPRTELLTSAFDEGAAEWNRHALYGEYTLVRASNVRDADVVLRWNDEPPSIDVQDCEPDVSIAVTTFCLRSDDESRLHVFPLLPPNDGAQSSVRMVVSILGTLESDPDDVRRLVVHELGHVLGIANHSGDAGDLMAPGVPSRATLSARDRHTLHVLYQTEPAIVP